MVNKRVHIRGQSLIELMIAIGMASILLPAMITGIILSREGRAQQKQRLEAISIAKETEAAVKNVRDRGWSYISTNGTYYPQISGSQWILSSGTSTANGITKSVVVTDTYRNAGGAIVTSGGTLDPSTKTITINISWIQPYPSQISSVLYLTRFQDNISYIETTQTQFNSGTKTGTTVRATSGNGVADDGEIILGAGGYGNWCEPSLSTSFFDLPGNGIATDIVAEEGKAYIGTGNNASGMDFINVSISNPAHPSPPAVINQGTYDANLKTNDVYGEKVGATAYAYIATNDTSREVVILNASTNPPTVVSNINLFRSPDATSVVVSNNILFTTTTANELFAYNVANRSAPVYLSTLNLGNYANRLYVVGSYLFVASAASTNQLKIVNISNPSNMQVVGQLTLNARQGVNVVVNSSGTRAYIITSGDNNSQPELFIVNVSNKAAPSIIGSYNTGYMDPKGIAITTANRLIVVGYGGEEYQVVSIDNESSPTRCGGADTPYPLNAVSSVTEADGDVYSYVVSTDSSAEFRIVIGGPGGQYASSGQFESATFNPGYQTANNRFSATYDKPTNTNIQFQVSMANLVSGACPTSGYTFLGPDSTSNTYFTSASGASVPFPVGSQGSYSNPGQCFRYKVFLSTTDGTSTPVLKDFTINYSP